MRIGPVEYENNALHPLLTSPALDWLPWGPAAGRAASALVSGDNVGRTLSWMASYPDADLGALARAGDPLLAGGAQGWLATAQLTAASQVRGAGWFPPPAGPPQPVPDPWKVSWFPDRVRSVGSADELIQLAQYATGNQSNTDWLPPASGNGANALVPHLFNNSVWKDAGSHRYATLAMQAEASEPTPQVGEVKTVIEPGHFKSAAGVLGAGFFGVVTGALAGMLGAPLPLAFSLGGLGAAASLWRISDWLPKIDLTPVWDFFKESVGGVITRAVDWLLPGEALFDRPAADPVHHVGKAITSSNPPVVDQLTDALWEGR